MKKVLIFLTVIASLLFICFFPDKTEDKESVNAPQIETVQSATPQQLEHMTFKGIPIDGTVKEFVAKLTNVGFDYRGKFDGVTKLRGEFAGNKDCTIIVYSLESTNKVNAVGVIFPSQYNWLQLRKDYDTLRTMLTEKYGNTSERKEDNTEDDDLLKTLALYNSECERISQYVQKNGVIELSIIDYAVVLRYFDRINTTAVRSQAMDDL